MNVTDYRHIFEPSLQINSQIFHFDGERVIYIAALKMIIFISCFISCFLFNSTFYLITIAERLWM